MIPERKTLTPALSLLWVLCLAAVTVGAKNFEEGLSIDAPLYADIGRNLARSTNWINLSAQVPEFRHFVEHPHLGFWFLGAVFKVLPTADWSARIPGHLFYVLFLWTFFLFLRRFANESVAVCTVLLLVLWYRFANFFSNVYLDPGALFFGASAMFLVEGSFCRSKPGLASLGGISLAGCFLYKGVVGFGFLPAVCLVGWLSRTDRQALRRRAVYFGAAFLFALGGYGLALSHYGSPEFIQEYWARQIGERAHAEWRWLGLFRMSFWKSLFQDSSYLSPLAAVPLVIRPTSPRTLLPLSLLLPFLFLYGCAGLEAGQYWITVLPWVAWLVSEGLFGSLNFNTRKVAHVTGAAALIGLFVLQYQPKRTHGVQPPPERQAINKVKREKLIHRLIVDNSPEHTSFATASRFAWYNDLPIEYSDTAKQIKSDAAYLLLNDFGPRREELKANGWCLENQFPQSSLWVRCPSLG